MKYIFDFDDVLFFTTKHRTGPMIALLQKAGIPEDKITDYYQIARLQGFSLKAMLAHFFTHTDIDEKKLYEDIFAEIDTYKNTDLLACIKTLGKENCFLITAGNEEFQKDKIRRTDIGSLFSEIIVVPGDASKKDAVEHICKRYKNEEVYFVDDKPRYFEDLDLERCPNLKTILYKGQDLNNI